MNAKACVCLAGALLAGGCARGDFAVAVDGEAKCRLEKTGVGRVDADIAFFTNAVFRMTGARLPVGDASVAPSGRANRIVFQVESRALADEDDWALTFPDARTMKITGSESSCRWALNRLVEGWGAVFCFPGPRGTHYPGTNRLSVAYVPMSGTMSLKVVRDMYAEDPEWERSLGCRHFKDKFFNHAMYDWLPVGKYGKEPWLSEVMPERNGRRARPASAASGWQPCYASRKGVDEVVLNVLAWLEKRPGRRVCSLSVNDLEGYCECARCKEMNGGTFSKSSRFIGLKSHSESYYRWVNAVADGVMAKRPDVWFGVLAYCGTIDPPSFRLNPHVVPFLCCETYQTQDPKVFASREALFAAWSEKAEAFGIWDYAYGCRAYQAPRVYPKTMEAFFALKKKYPKLQAFFFEGDSFVGEGPKRYLYGKFISDPGCTLERELGRWYPACCGAAAADDLKAYYDIWEGFYRSDAIKKSLWYERGIGKTYLDFDVANYVFAMPEAALEEATHRMKRVLAAAEASGDDDQRERARRLWRFHELYEARLVSGGVGLADARGVIAGAEGAAQFFGRLPAMCGAFARARELSAEIAAQRAAECPADPRILGHCKSLREYSERGANLTWLLSQAIDFAEDPLVREAMSRIQDDPRLDATRRESVKGILSLDSAPNLAYPEGLSPEEDCALWKKVDNGMAAVNPRIAPDGTRQFEIVNEKGGWPAAVKVLPSVPTGCDFILRVRLRNNSKAPVKLRMFYTDCVPGSWRSTGGISGEKFLYVRPGKTLATAVICSPGKRKAGKTTAARLYFIQNGLPKGESVTVEKLEFKPLGRLASGGGRLLRGVRGRREPGVSVSAQRDRRVRTGPQRAVRAQRAGVARPGRRRGLCRSRLSRN